MKNSRLFAFGGVAIAGLMVFLGIFWFVRGQMADWIPTSPEPPVKVFFEAKWGFMGIGIYRASGKDKDFMDDGFQNYYIKGSKVYIADTIKDEISLFEHNKLVRAYKYPKHVRYDLGVAATADYIYLLDDEGYITKINAISGVHELHKQVILDKDSGFIPKNSYKLYLLNDVIVAQGPPEKDRCFAAQDLSEIPCPFKMRDDPSYKTDFVYLPHGYYAGIVSGSDVWLYESGGKKVGRVRGIDKVNLLYDAGKNYQIDINGVYFAEHFDATGFDIGVKIYFKPWQK